MINQILKILHTASFFLAELTVSTLLIILQSLLAPYQLLLYNKSLLLQYCYGLPHILLIEQIRNIPYFYFAFSVLWSSPVIEVLMTTTYHLSQWLSQYTSRVFGKISFSFFAKNSIDRIKESLHFHDKPKSKSTAFVYCTGL